MKYLEWGWKILSVMVIPLVIWGANMQTQVAVQATEISRLKTDVKDALALKDVINTNGLATAKLEATLNATNDNLSEIRRLLNGASK